MQYLAIQDSEGETINHAKSVTQLFKVSDTELRRENWSQNFVTAYSVVTAYMLHEVAMNGEFGKTILSSLMMIMFQWYRTYIDKLNVTKITEVMLTKDLKYIYMKYMMVPHYEKFAVSSFMGMHSHHKNHLTGAMMRIRLFYPILIKHDDHQLSEEQMKAIKMAQEMMIEKHGDTAKKTIEIENEMRTTSFRLLFTKTHNLLEAYSDTKMAKQLGEKVEIDELIKKEAVEFNDGNVEAGLQTQVLMAALNGYELKYEGEEDEPKGSDDETETESESEEKE